VGNYVFKKEKIITPTEFTIQNKKTARIRKYYNKAIAMAEV